MLSAVSIVRICSLIACISGLPIATAETAATETTAASPARAVSGLAIAAAWAEAAAVSTPEARGTQRHELRGEIVELLLLLGMRLEDIVDLLAVGVGDLRAAESTLTK